MPTPYYMSFDTGGSERALFRLGGDGGLAATFPVFKGQDLIYDAVILGVIANESNGPLDVLDDLWNGIARLAAVDDGKNRVTTIEQRPEAGGIDRLV